MSDTPETPESPTGPQTGPSTGPPVQEPMSDGRTDQIPVEPDEGHVKVDSPVDEPAPEVPDTPAPAAEEPAFFDRKEWETSLEGLKDNPDQVEHLRSLEKMLLGQWTKKTQGIAEERQKVEAYNAFMEYVERDPQGAIVSLQQQLGLTPSADKATNVADQATGEKEYSDWGEVFADIKKDVMEDMRREFAPAMASVHKMTTQQVESQLDGIDSDWRLYEDGIAATLKKYPNMANDIPTLYRNSVPPEILEQRATKVALERLEKQTKAAALASPAPVRSKKGSPTKAMSFQEAYEQAKKDV